MLAEIIERKIRAFGVSAYPMIMETAYGAPDGFVAASILHLIDPSKGNRDELREFVMEIYEKHPNNGNMLDFVYQIMGEIGKPGDVFRLLAANRSYHYFLPAVQTFGKIATPEQLPEIEKALDQSRKEIQEQHKMDEKTWDEKFGREMQETLETIRNRNVNE